MRDYITNNLYTNLVFIEFQHNFHSNKQQIPNTSIKLQQMSNEEYQNGGVNPQARLNTVQQQDRKSLNTDQKLPYSQQQFIVFFKTYEPKSKYVDIQKLHQSSNLKLKRYKQATYYGEFLDCKRNGQGILIYDNERFYQGNWVQDARQGQGYERFPNGCHYEGNYQNGKPHGFGKYFWKNGEIYQGQWQNGLKHGSGMWQGVNGDSYIGEWRNGKADGYGVHTWANGDRYQGQFKQCLKHGQGIQKFSNGDIYKGAYQNGKPSGFGQYYWINGSYFKGNFKNGLRDGEGIWKKGPGNCDKYQGEYRNDKKCGYGIFTWANGNIYKGNYQGDLRHGYGEMFWIDNTFYKGHWNKGVQHGKGEIYIPNVGYKKGMFEDNILVEVQLQSQRYTGGIDQSRALRKQQIQPPPLPHEKTKFRTRAQTSKFHRSRNIKVNEVSMGEDAYQEGKASRAHSNNYNPNNTLHHYYIKSKTKVPKPNIENSVTSQKSNKGSDRILHSAFYLKRLHNKKNIKNTIANNLGHSAKQSSDQYGLHQIKKNSLAQDLPPYRRQIHSMHGYRQSYGK